MSKKVRTIVIGAVVIVVLAAVTALLVLLPQNKEEETVSSSSESTVITFANQSSDQLKSLTIKNADDEYTIDLVGESIWRIRDIQDFPANDSRYATTRNDVCSVSAMQMVEENSQKLADYGLTTPQAQVRVEFQDGASYEVALGNLSPDGTRRYALLLNESSSDVYGLAPSTLSCAFLTRNDYLDTSITPAFTPADESKTVPDINRLTITGDYLEKPITIEEIKKDDPDVVSSMDIVKMTSPINSLVNMDWMQNNVYNMLGLAATKVAKASPTEADLAEYGLDAPWTTYELHYEGSSSFKLLIGKGIDGEGNVPENAKDITSYYVMKDGTDLVYVVNAASLTWLNVEPRSLISSIITLPNIITVDNVLLTLDGKDYTLKITQLPSEDDTSSNTNPDLAFTLNGEEVNDDMSRKFYQVLLSTSIQDINTAEPTGEPTMTIVYNQTDGRKQTIDFYVQPDLTTIVSLNGNNAYVGRSGMVDKVRKELGHLQNGETVDTDW